MADRTAWDARRKVLEEALGAVAEQRCERTFTKHTLVTYRPGQQTPWDSACLAAMEAIQALIGPEPTDG